MAETAAAADPAAPAVAVEDAGPCLKRLRIETPAEAVSKQLDEALSTLGAEVALPGFRKGKAPRRLIERRFGKASRDEARQRIITDAYRKAIEEQDLRVVGEPELSDEIAELEVEPGKPLTFTIEVEVAPEVALPALEGVKVYRPIIEITPDMVERELDRLCADHGSLEDREAAAPGDYCTGRGVMTIEGEEEPVLDIPGAVVRAPTEDSDGSGMILGVKVANFDEQFGSPKVGERVEIRTTGPDQHENEKVRGAPIVITFDIDKIYRVKPASPDETAEALGLGDADQLRAIITQRLEHRATLEQQSALRSQLASALIERVEFDLPERMTAKQAARNLERRRLDMEHRGASQEEIDERLAELRDASDETARRELKLFFILDAAARELEVEATEQEVQGYIAQMAASRGLRPADVRNELVRSGRVQGVAQQIREHKTLDALLGKVEIEEVPLEQYNEMIEGRGAGEAARPAAERATKKKKSSKKTSKKSGKKTAKKTAKKKTAGKKKTSRKKSG